MHSHDGNAGAEDALAFWSRRWRALVEERRSRIEHLLGLGSQEGYWDRRAASFHRMTQAGASPDDAVQGLLRELIGTGTLLDVGAGTGRHALPLASVARHVTAVEPSAAMRSYMQASIREHGIANVSIVPEPWEAASVAPHDVALVAHVLYPIADVVPFLRKVDAASRRACVIVLRVEQVGAGIESLWREIWGVPRPPEPTFLDLYNLLFAMGIRANARIIPFGPARQGATLDEALQQIRGLLFLADGDPRLESVVRPRLPDVLVDRGDHWAWKEQRHAAVVWWTKP